VLRELKAMYGTVRRNLGKRKIAQPWMLQTTTAYRPGEQSIAEETLTAWRKGELSPAVHVDHREAKGRVDLDDETHTLASSGRCTAPPLSGWTWTGSTGRCATRGPARMRRPRPATT
jgi:hypothetical protein